MKPTPADKRVVNKVFVMVVIAVVVVVGAVFLMGWSPFSTRHTALESGAADAAHL